MTRFIFWGTTTIGHFKISGGNIVSIEAIVTGEPRNAPEGTWVIGGGIETPYKYLIYADKKLKSKIRTILRKASM